MESNPNLKKQTAEMPGFYSDKEYDLSGFAVGIVRKDAVIDGRTVEDGDILIGLSSSGVHSNGFSLVRRVLAESGRSLDTELPGGGGSVTLAEALMAPTVIYVKQVLEMIGKGGVKAVAHITGGGFTDNIPRVLPRGLGAEVYTDSWDTPPIFKWIQEEGRVEEGEMRRTFNMGIGMVMVVSPERSASVVAGICEMGEKAYEIGKVVSGTGVTYF